MSYQTEEQQIEQLKEWWKENGTALIVGAVLGLSGFFGWKYWTAEQVSYQESASSLYLQLTDELEKENSTLIAEKAAAVKEQYGDTSYAILSAFHLAKIAVDEKKLDEAASELKWVLDNHSNNELAQVAKMRLARVLLAQEKAEEALTLLAFPAESGYFEMASFIKGDALLALGRKAEALEAYKAASNVGKFTAGHPTLKIIIDELTASQTAEVMSDSHDSPSDENNSEDALKEEKTEPESVTEGASK